MSHYAIHNVEDRIHHYIGTCIGTGPVVISKLMHRDIGRAVVSTAHHGQKEFGYISSWNEKLVFVRFHQGDTAAGVNPKSLEFVMEKPK